VVVSKGAARNPEFYSLVKTLDLYKELPEKEIQLLISTEREFFRYLKGISWKKE
jgi:hypothetical protein